MALKRRETAELIAEELRRLDPDDTYASALRFGVDQLGGLQSAAQRAESPYQATALPVRTLSDPAEPARPATPAPQRPPHPRWVTATPGGRTPAQMPPVKKADAQ